MENIKLFLISCMILLALPLISAQTMTGLGVYKQHTCIQLPQTANATYCNITAIYYPNGTFAVSTPINMTKRGTSFNASFCDTSAAGQYIVNGDCDTVVWAYDFTVTPSGGDESLTIFLVAIIFAVSLLLIAFILKNYIFSFISGAAFIVAGIYAMIFGFGNVANDYTRMIAVVIIGIGLITSIISALDLLGDVSGEGDDDYVYEEE